MGRYAYNQSASEEVETLLHAAEERLRGLLETLPRSGPILRVLGGILGRRAFQLGIAGQDEIARGLLREGLALLEEAQRAGRRRVLTCRACWSAWARIGRPLRNWSRASPVPPIWPDR